MSSLFCFSCCWTFAFQLGIPKFPKETLSPIVVSEGEPITLKCNPPEGVAPRLIYWMTVGKPWGGLSFLWFIYCVFQFINLLKRKNKSYYCFKAVFLKVTGGQLNNYYPAPGSHSCLWPDAVFNAVINTAPASPQELGAILITRVSTNRSVRLERGDCCSAVPQSSHSSPSPGRAGYARPTTGPQHYSITASRIVILRHSVIMVAPQHWGASWVHKPDV